MRAQNREKLVLDTCFELANAAPELQATSADFSALWSTCLKQAAYVVSSLKRGGWTEDVAANWDEEVCLTSKVRLNNTVTFYSKFGDYIGRVSVFVFSILMMVLFVRRFLLRK